MIKIGPDGKVKVEKFGETRWQVRRRKNAGKKPATKSETRIFSFGKAFKIGPDGKMEGVESLPENVQELLKQAKPGAVSVGGSVTIIGPDGKKHTHALGDGKLDAESISKSIEKALEGAGKELPKEVQDQLKESLKDLPKAFSFQMGGGQPFGRRLDHPEARQDPEATR